MLGRIHFYFGLLVVILFLLTGQYMHHTYHHLHDMELMNRALFRAGHIYILLFGLINIGIGTYFKSLNSNTLSIIQLTSSTVIIVATLLVIYGFFTELPSEDIERPLTRLSLYLILAAVIIQGFISRLEKR